MGRSPLLLIPALLASASAQARPVSDSTRIGGFLGARYVPHGHLRQEASGSGVPLNQDTPVGFEGMLSFAYRPESSLEVALEVGYTSESFNLGTAHIGVTDIPIVASVRFAPLDTALYPYVGAGGGYMLNFFTGVPSGEVENHSREYHALVGLGWDLSPRWSAFLEDRYQIALPDIIPVGELETGGNVLMIGFSFVMAPEPPLAPH